MTHDVTTKSVTKAADSIATREVRGEERDLIKVPISSTAQDRDGDQFATDALEGMADQIRSQKPNVFLNHGFTEFHKPLYDTREKIGALIDAEVDRGKDGEEEDAVLNGFILPDTTHEEGERTLEQIKNGQPEKFSVGFRVKDAEPLNPEAENDERRKFIDVDLMETSKVGIPSNPEASASVAAKAAGLTERLTAAGMEIDDEAAFAKHLAAELVSADGPVTSEDVQHATPVDGDGEEPVDTERRDGDDVTKPKCDSDEDCPDGEVCEDGHCVDAEEAEETDNYLMTDEAEERLETLEERLASLEDTIEEALAATDGSEGEPDADETAGEQPDEDPPDPPETFEVDDEEFTREDIRELREQAAAVEADDADVDDSKTETGREDPDETDDADGSDSDADDGESRSLQETVYA